MRHIRMQVVSSVAIRLLAARAEPLFMVATDAARLKLRKPPFASRERQRPVRLPAGVLLAQVALLFLICQAPPRCAAAETAPAPQPPAIATNQAGNDSAEVAWKQLQKALRPPVPPESWRTNSPTQEDREAFNKRNGELAAQVADQASEFYTRFPDHPKAQEARQRELDMRKTAVQLGNVKQVARLNELEEGRAKNTQTEPGERFLLRWQSIQREALKSGPSGSPAFLDEVQKGVFTLRKEFPERSEVYELLMQLLQLRSQEGEAEQARALAQTLLESSIREEAKDSVRRMIRKFDFLGKAIPLKFTASDGRAIDLEKMRGKVVMIDFWASWCVPCMIELPKVRAAYQKLQPQGFEILGINLDEDTEQMQRVLKSSSITWPQHFDGLKWESPLVSRFGIMSIPTLWLIDKRGVLRDLNPGANLVERVEKLLQEKTE